MRPWGGFNSIFGRIIVLHALTVAVTAAAIGGAAYLLFDNLFLSFEHRTLEQREIAIAAALEHTPAGWTLRLPPGLDALYVQRGGGFSYAVADPDGRVLFASMPVGRLILPMNSPTDSAHYVRPAHGGPTSVAASFLERRGGATVWVQIAQDLGHPDQITDDVLKAALNILFWVVIGVVLMLALADALIVRRALRPVLAASRMAGEIDPNRIDLRLPTAQLPTEIRPLAAAVNQALDRLEDGFRVQREFTADAAHELRTPLTVVRLRIEALCDAATATALKADIDVMARIVGQLLSIAELEGLTLDPDRGADLCAVGERVASYLAPLAGRQQKQVAFGGPESPVWVQGDPELLFQAARNLVENAILHTPPGSAVEIEVDAAGALRVLDRGPGVPESERPLLFQRFWRRSRQTSAGAGLGLSIVARIAAAHRGSVTVADRPGGGAVFALQLQPLAKAGGLRN